jgi:hypothetical protein
LQVFASFVDAVTDCLPLPLLQNLLSRLASCKQLKQLQLLSGRQQPGSQLPRYSPPVWMQVGPTSTAALLSAVC